MSHPIDHTQTPLTTVASQPSVLTIGSFDGVHAGHCALIARARAIASAAVPRARVVALVFDPSPSAVLHPDAAPPRLSTFEQRAEWLREAGADDVFRLEPTRELLDHSAEEFVREQVRLHRPIAWVEGPDFRFGKNRSGDIDTLIRLGVVNDFHVSIVSGIEVALDDHAIVPARSTMVRWLLAHGRVRDAALVLGRPHELLGKVVPGERRGRTIGYPTANLSTECFLPSDGVYASFAILPDQRRVPAALSIGVKPTFGVRARAVEAFLMVPGEQGRPWVPLAGLPEYQWPLRLELIAFVRDQMTFAGLQPLIAQIERDCQRIHTILRDEPQRSLVRSTSATSAHSSHHAPPSATAPRAALQESRS